MPRAQKLLYTYLAGKHLQNLAHVNVTSEYSEGICEWVMSCHERKLVELKLVVERKSRLLRQSESYVTVVSAPQMLSDSDSDSDTYI